MTTNPRADYTFDPIQIEREKKEHRIMLMLPQAELLSGLDDFYDLVYKP